MSGSHVLFSADWGLLPARWAAHTCSSVQTESCYPQDEWLTRAPQHRLRVVTRKMSGSHVLLSADWGLLPTRWVAHTCSSVQTEGCYPQDEWLTRAPQCRLRVVTRKMSSSHVLLSADWGLLPARWVAHTCSSAQTQGCHPRSHGSLAGEGTLHQKTWTFHATLNSKYNSNYWSVNLTNFISIKTQLRFPIFN